MSLLNQLSELDVKLFALGGVDFYLSTLLKLALLLILLFLVAARVSAWVINRALQRTHFDLATKQTIGALAHYATLGIGLLIIVQTAGVNLTTFNVVAGAVGVGVGFGLQNIFSNFISGLIIMFERPIKVGDRIELAGVDGTVLAIGARRTTVVNRDNVAIIVPNQRFILENVINLLYAHQRIRVRVPVTVAAGTDARAVERLLLEAAQTLPAVLSNPGPSVELLALGPTVNMELLVWTDLERDSRRELTSVLNFAIDAKLRANQIRTA